MVEIWKALIFSSESPPPASITPDAVIASSASGQAEEAWLAVEESSFIHHQFIGRGHERKERKYEKSKIGHAKKKKLSLFLGTQIIY